MSSSASSTSTNAARGPFARASSLCRIHRCIGIDACLVSSGLASSSAVVGEQRSVSTFAFRGTQGPSRAMVLENPRALSALASRVSARGPRERRATASVLRDIVVGKHAAARFPAGADPAPLRTVPVSADRARGIAPCAWDGAPLAFDVLVSSVIAGSAAPAATTSPWSPHRLPASESELKDVTSHHIAAGDDVTNNYMPAAAGRVQLLVDDDGAPDRLIRRRPPADAAPGGVGSAPAKSGPPPVDGSAVNAGPTFEDRAQSPGLTKQRGRGGSQGPWPWMVPESRGRRRWNRANARRTTRPPTRVHSRPGGHRADAGMTQASDMQRRVQPIQRVMEKPHVA